MGRGEELQILDDGHALIHAKTVGHEAKDLADGVGFIHAVVPIDDHPAHLRLDEAEDFALGDMKPDIVEHLRRAEAMRNTFYVDHCASAS